MRIRSAVVIAAALVGLGSGVASADDSYPEPGSTFTCTGTNLGSADCPYGSDQVGNPADFYGSSDEQFPPTWFYVFGFLVVAAGIGTAVLRAQTASRMAERAGLDPGDAALTSLLSEDGLPAAYVMANLPGRAPAETGPRTVAQRLGDLQRLRDQGLISPEEYETRRTRILDEV